MAGMHSLPLDKLDRLLQDLPEKYAAIAAIGVTTGCRISEILALRRFDLLDPDGFFRSRIAFLKLKAGKVTHRKMRIPSRYRAYVIRHLQHEEERGWERPDDFVFRGKNGKHLSRLACYAVFRAHLGGGYGTHWMRKTFAQEVFRYLLREYPGDPMRALEITRKALGHARIDTTIKYLGIEEDQIDAAQESIFG